MVAIATGSLNKLHSTTYTLRSTTYTLLGPPNFTHTHSTNIVLITTVSTHRAVGYSMHTKGVQALKTPWPFKVLRLCQSLATGLESRQVSSLHAFMFTQFKYGVA